MPKPNMAAMLPDNAVESTSFGGKFEVLGSTYRVHKDKEYELKPGEKPRIVDKEGNAVKAEKVVALVMKCTPISDDGERLEDADMRDLVLKLGGKSLSMFHPGKGSSATDEDPEDMGDDLNTEGNTLFIAPDAKVEINAKSGYNVFMKSLQHKGFPPEKIAQCFAPNFKGLKFELITVTPDKLEKYGQAKGEKSEITYKVVENIIAMPKGVKAKVKAEDDDESPKKPAKAKKPAADDDDDDAPAKGAGAEDEAKRVLGATAEKLAGKVKSLDKVKIFFTTTYSDPKVKGAAKLQDAARKFVNDDEWLKKALKKLGAVTDDDGDVTFKAAADEDE